eukprot:gene5823-24950_t
MQLYVETNGPEWGKKDGWGDAGSLCRWYGVKCTDDRIREINLYNNLLTGTIDAVAGLTNLDLETLILVENNLTGPIEAVGQLTRLTDLRLFQSSFTGNINA